MAVDLLANLTKTFSLMDNDYAYFDLINMTYRQESKTIKVYDSYFDFKSSGFLHWRSLRNNLEVLYKLDEYKENMLICTDIINNGFMFSVYNEKGNLVYKNKVVFFDKLNKLQKFFLRRKFNQLVNKKSGPFIKS